MVEAWWNRNSAIGRLAVHDPARRLARRPSTGTASWAAPRSGLRARPPLPLAQLPTTTAPASRATCSSTSSPASTSSRARWGPPHHGHGRAPVLEGRPRRCRTSCSASSTTRRPTRTPSSRSRCGSTSRTAAGGEEAFRFVGREGIISIGRDGVTITRATPTRSPATRSTPSRRPSQETFLKEYRKKYPETNAPSSAPAARRGSGRPRVQRAGRTTRELHRRRAHTQARGRGRRLRLRAAGPALLCNQSYFEGKPVLWDAKAMKVGAMTRTTSGA